MPLRDHEGGLRVLLPSAAVLAVGIAATGWWVGDGLVDARTGDRYVTVKGLAERPARADLAIWPLRFVATSNDLAEAQSRIARDAETISGFLAAAGIGSADIELQSLEVTDLHAQAYRSGPVESRFIVAQTLMVRTTAVDTIAAASQNIGDLVAAGVVLGAANHGPPGPFYLFTTLNDVKPQMIADATQNARDAAEQFAADSGSDIGGIRRASQGLFQILPRDQAPGLQESAQIHKTIRVVTTVEYTLDD
ncbi:MAG: SIMPL domain-containing protein [Rhodospirillales bacterium]|nr:SIMPL domain-containing protein [Rhodospirillales bacterium]